MQQDVLTFVRFSLLLPLSAETMPRVGQNHIYAVYVRYGWQENHQKYGHIRCTYTVLANPIYDRMFSDFPAKKHRIYILYMVMVMVMANPTHAPCNFE